MVQDEAILKEKFTSVSADMRKATTYIHFVAKKKVMEQHQDEEIDVKTLEAEILEEKQNLAAKAFDAIEGVIASLEKE